jgi:hypothetical protein
MHAVSTCIDSSEPVPSGSVGEPAAAAPPSASLSDGWLVPSAASFSSSSAAPITSFPSFFSLVSQSSLAVVQSGRFNAATLYRFARDSVACEEQVATGCLLIQAATLVQCWALTHQQDPLEHEREVVQFGQ